VGGDLGDPVQDREQGKVSLEVRVHLGAVEHGLGIFAVGHLLLGEGGTGIYWARLSSKKSTEAGKRLMRNCK
jgi:hypothetical protein